MMIVMMMLEQPNHLDHPSWSKMRRQQLGVLSTGLGCVDDVELLRLLLHPLCLFLGQPPLPVGYVVFLVTGQTRLGITPDCLQLGPTSGVKI